mgnify:CR=1 FL=1
MVSQNDGSSEPKAVVRPYKDVPSDSLQNPSDPDAGSSSHKGKGYQIQVVENYSEKDTPHLSLFTHIDVESADQHDDNALLPAHYDLQELDMAPGEIMNY